MNNISNNYIDREKSWLTFNARVLQEANDESVPLLDRFRFLGIFSNNLDEFFRVRYAAIRRMSLETNETEKILGVPAEKLLKEITEIVIEQQSESLRILSLIEKELVKEGVFIINEKEVTRDQEAFLKDPSFCRIKGLVRRLESLTNAKPCHPFEQSLPLLTTWL